MNNHTQAQAIEDSTTMKHLAVVTGCLIAVAFSLVVAVLIIT